jgi:hypothetical protein
MRVRALKTHMGRHGLIRAGIVFTIDDRYGEALCKSGIVERVSLQPEQTTAYDSAPRHAEQRYEQQGPRQPSPLVVATGPIKGSPVDLPEGGTDAPPLLRRRGRPRKHPISNMPAVAPE